tara:strand:- start:3285 stop:4055 length:771 start_codon:yes stop_codon:yes gene_type:complete
MTTNQINFNELTTAQQENLIFNAPLPQRTRTYTPIHHESIIKKVKELLNQYGYKISNVDYIVSSDYRVITGKYALEYGPDDIKMIMAIQNSYNKKVSAKHVLGGYVTICTNGMYDGDFPFAGKHTGDIDKRYFESLESNIFESKNTFDKILNMADSFKHVTLSQQATDNLFGQLFRERKIFTDSQFLNFRQEYFKKVPTFDYGVENKNNMWNLYNLATGAIEARSNSSNYIKTHLNISNFFNRVMKEEVQEQMLYF